MKNKRERLDMRVCKMNTCRHKLFGRMPVEMIGEVLLRLPVKDVHRAKCVCKQWHSIISSPKFMEEHSRWKHEPCHGIFIATADDDSREFVFYYSLLQEEEEQVRSRNTRMVPPHPRVFVPRFRVSYVDYQWTTQVVNGLVCVYSNNRLTLLSLCTGEMVDLPLAPLPPGDAFTATTVDFRTYFSKVVEKVKIKPFHGAAEATNLTAVHFDTEHKVYKVLSMSYMCRAECLGPGNICECPSFIMPYVLTLSGPTSSYKWKEVLHPRATVCKYTTQSACFNGWLYWMPEPEEAPEYDAVPMIMFSSFSFIYDCFGSVTAVKPCSLPDSYEFFFEEQICRVWGTFCSIGLLFCQKDVAYIFFFVPYR